MIRLGNPVSFRAMAPSWYKLPMRFGEYACLLPPADKAKWIGTRYVLNVKSQMACGWPFFARRIHMYARS